MTRYGSLNNMLMDGVAPFEPEIGMGATILYWSDRKAATIVDITRFKSGPKAGQVKAITVQQDIATRTDSWGMSDAQSYNYQPDPDAPTRTFSLRKDGRYRDSGGTSIRIGSRDQYYDYSF